MESDGVLDVGVDIQGASTNVVGGTTAAERNVISGNGVEPSGAGVRIVGSTATENAVRGNAIGLSTDGQLELPNRVGVAVAGGASDNVVGGSTFESTNFIAGNTEDGVSIRASGNRVQSNFIGFTWNTASRRRARRQRRPRRSGHCERHGDHQQHDRQQRWRWGLRGRRDGWRLDPAHEDSPERGPRHRPRAGRRDARTMASATPTPGPNGLQNFPELEDVTFDGSSVTVQGTLESAPSTTFALDFFSSGVSVVNPVGCDPSGFGEGAGEFGSDERHHECGRSSRRSRRRSRLPSVSPGAFITATATASGRKHVRVLRVLRDRGGAAGPSSSRTRTTAEQARSGRRFSTPTRPKARKRSRSPSPARAATRSRSQQRCRRSRAPPRSTERARAASSALR